MQMTVQREEISIGPLTIGFLLTGRDSEGALSMFEFAVPAGARVPVAHSHDAYEETLYGLEGALTWTVAGEEHEVGVGEVLHVPRGVVHRFENRGQADAKALAVVTPGILGPEYFHDLAELVQAGGPPDPAAIAAVMRRHGLTPVPD
jgi:quercetin dioxygenase-like cupin family protein